LRALNLKIHLLDRGYPCSLIEELLSEIKFTGRVSALRQNNKTKKEIMPFITQFQPSVSNTKEALTKPLTKWHLIHNQPLLRHIFKESPIISYKKGKSLKDLLVRTKIS